MPFTYTSPFYTAATYTDAQCIIAKNLTEASTELLYSGGADVTFPTVDAWLATFQVMIAAIVLSFKLLSFECLEHKRANEAWLATFQVQF